MHKPVLEELYLPVHTRGGRANLSNSTNCDVKPTDYVGGKKGAEKEESAVPQKLKKKALCQLYELSEEALYFYLLRE